VRNGKFVDVGSMDGVMYSNTYSFEQAGWSGICVEAHPFYYDLTVKNRPKSTNVHAAVAECNKEEVEFYACEIGALSTLNPNMSPYFKKNYSCFTGHTTIKVPQLSLNTILKNNNFVNFDFLSIDVEGEELNVLKGLDLTTYSPRIILSEAITKDREDALKTHLNKFGYTYARNLWNNLFFSNVTLDIPKIRNLKLTKSMLGKIIKTKHPLK
jgi:FkbM family methyltransferase